MKIILATLQEEDSQSKDERRDVCKVIHIQAVLVNLPSGRRVLVPDEVFTKVRAHKADVAE